MEPFFSADLTKADLMELWEQAAAQLEAVDLAFTEADKFVYEFEKPFERTQMFVGGNMFVNTSTTS